MTAEQFIKDYTRTCSNEPVEIARKEMIDKACKWLRKELVNFEDYSGMGGELISDFRKVMEE